VIRQTSHPFPHASYPRAHIGEADTVTIVTDTLADVFGFEMFSEITSEYSIRGTYCDLATKIDGQLRNLIEVKAVGSDLKDAHVKQAVDYAANQGVDWEIATGSSTYILTFGAGAQPGHRVVRVCLAGSLRRWGG